MYSGQSAGINLYDANGLIIKTFLLSITFYRYFETKTPPRNRWLPFLLKIFKQIL